MHGIDSEPLTESELLELEGVMERHRTLIGVSRAYGLFTSFCIPRLLRTVRNLQRELELVRKERDQGLGCACKLTA
jgi:hypothetical protein